MKKKAKPSRNEVFSPLPLKVRCLSGRGLFAFWCLLGLGASSSNLVAHQVSLGGELWSTLFLSAITLVLVGVALSRVGREGLAHGVGFASQLSFVFGHSGYLFPLVLRTLLGLFWFIVSTWALGQVLLGVLSQLGSTFEGGYGLHVLLYGVVATCQVLVLRQPWDRLIRGAIGSLIVLFLLIGVAFSILIGGELRFPVVEVIRWDQTLAASGLIFTYWVSFLLNASDLTRWSRESSNESRLICLGFGTGAVLSLGSVFFWMNLSDSNVFHLSSLFLFLFAGLFTNSFVHGYAVIRGLKGVFPSQKRKYFAEVLLLIGTVIGALVLGHPLTEEKLLVLILGLTQILSPVLGILLTTCFVVEPKSPKELKGSAKKKERYNTASLTAWLLGVSPSLIFGIESPWSALWGAALGGATYSYLYQAPETRRWIESLFFRAFGFLRK